MSDKKKERIIQLPETEVIWVTTTLEFEEDVEAVGDDVIDGLETVMA